MMRNTQAGFKTISNWVITGPVSSDHADLVTEIEQRPLRHGPGVDLG
jgi:hypothetical protein